MLSFLPLQKCIYTELLPSAQAPSQWSAWHLIPGLSRLEATRALAASSLVTESQVVEGGHDSVHHSSICLTSSTCALLCLFSNRLRPGLHYSLCLNYMEACWTQAHVSALCEIGSTVIRSPENILSITRF